MATDQLVITERSFSFFLSYLFFFLLFIWFVGAADILEISSSYAKVLKDFHARLNTAGVSFSLVFNTFFIRSLDGDMNQSSPNARFVARFSTGLFINVN